MPLVLIVRLMRIILSWVGILVVEEFRKFIVPRRDACPHYRTKPVEPVIAGELAGGDARTERPSRVQGTASEVNT